MAVVQSWLDQLKFEKIVMNTTVTLEIVMLIQSSIREFISNEIYVANNNQYRSIQNTAKKIMCFRRF